MPPPATRHLPGLVEHAKLSQRTEAGVELPGPGRWSRSGRHRRAAWLARTAPAASRAHSGAEAPWEKQAGSTRGRGAPQASGGAGPTVGGSLRGPAVPGWHS
ncbi:unnamed protein product [Rangifer tarandus platyrhynchus]|uniref:Uncharacterized protein n=2 Tax=Rangifer tarandus platyrhynchus TaxID=3082113 RepID=A0ABN8ZIF6_RANTA|nr:unnamed protein product [Rangifer tarandus platyrhynchus]CAI9708203.1 unnamed protein product [Rangifer tarandus platyrhynchus]